MGRAVICPVCGGTGKVRKGSFSCNPREVTCHGCHGRGWVEVSDK